ncbi:hypothetical protein PybrP1_004013 [[Pythium] brassicae (nom. inval.)]|nr:hypothetical protein PybrP1_004013 [[Pythium] brassicae (nom. inval.)]
MDLIEAMEREAALATSSAPALLSADDSHDAVLQQAAFVQAQLKALWAAKHQPHVDHDRAQAANQNVVVPFAWVLARLLRLAEEYPDGVTEAIVVTELMALLQRRVLSASADKRGSSSSSSRKVRGAEDLALVLAALEEEENGAAIPARLLDFDGHKLSLHVEKSNDLELKMYLHQRFRACAAFLSSQPQFQSSSAEGFPFQRGRGVVFTNAKAMERRDVGGADSAFALLPTQFLAVHVDPAGNALDKVLLSESIGLARLDQFVAMQDQVILQQLLVTVQVLDIGAVRPSQTPLHIHRQVLFLGDVERNAVGTGVPSTPQASHVMILWDEQVALSRLFHVGDELLIFQPYIHVCDDHDTEIGHVFSEYSSQQRCVFYMEYGSATVFFVKPPKAPLEPAGTAAAGVSPSAPILSPLQQFTGSEHPPLQYEAIQPDWANFALYGHVMSVRVSHGIPLMAAYFYAYYDPKTNGGSSHSTTRLPVAGAGAAGGGSARTLTLTPTLDRAIVSRYYLVVLLQLYNAASNQTLAVEVTGENALKALRLRPGQTVFLDGLVAVDVTSPAVAKAREHGTLAASTQQPAEPAFAFQSAHYTSNRLSSTVASEWATPSSIVALCSDWGSIFGKQSVLSENSRLTLVSSTQGLLKTSLAQGPQLAVTYARSPDSTRQVGMAILGRACITYAGWLIPATDRLPQPQQQQYSSDESCQKGHSTMYAHKACMRLLERVATPTSQLRDEGSGTPNDGPKWKCGFCQEIFRGTHETCQTFCTLVLCLDDGSTAQPHYAVCHDETVEGLLGTPAQDFSQLSLQDKAAS